MKTRNGFVSNSSSSSFIIGVAEILDETLVREALTKAGHTEVFESYEEKKEKNNILFEDKEAWAKYCDTAHWDNDLFIRKGTPTAEQFISYGGFDAEFYNEGLFCIDHNNNLIMETPVNDAEILAVKLDPEKKYLIFHNGHDEGDGVFITNRRQYEIDYQLDYSIVTDEYFKKNYPRSFKVLKLLKGVKGVTKEVAYKTGASRNG